MTVGIPGHGLSVQGLDYDKLYGPLWRVKLKTWLYTSPDPVLGAEITSVSSSGNRKAKATCDPYVAVALTVAT